MVIIVVAVHIQLTRCQSKGLCAAGKQSGVKDDGVGHCVLRTGNCVSQRACSIVVEIGDDDGGQVSGVVRRLNALRLDSTALHLQHPVARHASVVAGSGHVCPCGQSQLLHKAGSCFTLGHVTAVEQKISLICQRGTDDGQLGGVAV